MRLEAGRAGRQTRVLELDLDVKDGDDLSLALRDVDVALHAEELGHLDRNAVLLGGDGGDLLGEVGLRPVAGILVDLRGASEDNRKRCCDMETNPVPCRTIS